MAPFDPGDALPIECVAQLAGSGLAILKNRGSPRRDSNPVSTFNNEAMSMEPPPAAPGGVVGSTPLWHDIPG
jgi:hypothetical protein